MACTPKEKEGTPADAEDPNAGVLAVFARAPKPPKPPLPPSPLFAAPDAIDPNVNGVEEALEAPKPKVAGLCVFLSFVNDASLPPNVSLVVGIDDAILAKEKEGEGEFCVVAVVDEPKRPPLLGVDSPNMLVFASEPSDPNKILPEECDLKPAPGSVDTLPPPKDGTVLDVVEKIDDPKLLEPVDIEAEAFSLPPKGVGAVLASGGNVEEESELIEAATKAFVAPPPNGVGALVAIGGKADEDPELLEAATEAFVAPPPNGVGALDAIGGKAEEDPELLEATAEAFVAPPPNGVGALVAIGGNADVLLAMEAFVAPPKDGVGALIATAAGDFGMPLNGAGDLTPRGGAADDPALFAAGVFVAPPPKGVGALLVMGGNADEEDPELLPIADAEAITPPPKGLGTCTAMRDELNNPALPAAMEVKGVGCVGHEPEPELEGASPPVNEEDVEKGFAAVDVAEKALLFVMVASFWNAKSLLDPPSVLFKVWVDMCANEKVGGVDNTVAAIFFDSTWSASPVILLSKA